MVCHRRGGVLVRGGHQALSDTWATRWSAHSAAGSSVLRMRCSWGVVHIDERARELGADPVRAVQSSDPTINGIEQAFHEIEVDLVVTPHALDHPQLANCL